MRVAVEFSGESLDLELSDDRLVGSWMAPSGLTPGAFIEAARSALEQPLDFPALRQAVVPGDRVLIPVSPDVPGLGDLLGIVVEILETAGVERDAITVLMPPEAGHAETAALPPGVRRVVHDPEDPTGLAYLAATSAGRRVYLSRLLTDADFVLPIGRLGFDDRLGYAGPWSTLFPDLSDQATRNEFRALSQPTRPDPLHESQALAEAVEVGWLLGCQFQVAILPGAGTPIRILAGRDESARKEGCRLVDVFWTFRAPETADLVVAGLGLPRQPMGWHELSVGLATASRLVRPGGKIVVLSRADEPPGPSLVHLAERGDHDLGPAALRGRDGDPDHAIARRVAEALVNADIYLLSNLDPDFVEELGIIPLSRPEEARRLAAAAPSCTVVSLADQVRAEVVGQPR